MKAKVILIGTIAVMAALTYLETREVQELVTTDVEALTGVEKNPCGNVHSFQTQSYERWLSSSPFKWNT